MNADPVLAEFKLLSDSGSSSTDGLTANSSLFGRVTDDGEVGGIVVEFDFNQDSVVDASAVTDADGEFVFPSVLPMGSVALQARPKQWDVRTGSFATGDWVTLTFTHEVQANEAPRLLDLALVNDTGESTTDGITYDNRISGHITNEGSVQGRTIEFDHDGDSVVDGTVLTSGKGRFIYAATGLPLGGLTMRARTREFDAASQTLLFGSWTSIGFTLAAAPAVSVEANISGLSLQTDTGDNGNDGITSVATLVGTVTAAGSVEGVLIQFDLDGDGDADGATLATETGRGLSFFGTFEYTPTGLAAGEVTIAARARTWDDGDPVHGDWTSVTFTYEPDGAAGPYAPTDDYDEALDEASGEYHASLSAAAAAESAATAASRAAFEAAQAAADAAYQAALAVAASNFASAMSSYGGDPTDYGPYLPATGFAWPDAPPSSGGPPRVTDGAAGPEGLSYPDFSGPSTNLDLGPGYQAAMSAAQDAYNVAISAAQSAYDAASSAANSAYDAAIANSDNTLQQDREAAQTAYEAALQGTNPIDLAAVGTAYSNALAAASTAHSNAYSAAQAAHDTASNAASTAYTTACDAAQATHAAEIAASEAQLQADLDAIPEDADAETASSMSTAAYNAHNVRCIEAGRTLGIALAEAEHDKVIAINATTETYTVARALADKVYAQAVSEADKVLKAAQINHGAWEKDNRSGAKLILDHARADADKRAAERNADALETKNVAVAAALKTVTIARDLPERTGHGRYRPGHGPRSRGLR